MHAGTSVACITPAVLGELPRPPPTERRIVKPAIWPDWFYWSSAHSTVRTPFPSDSVLLAHHVRSGAWCLYAP